eukprot:scaffold2872_cov112-Isochrysis_galbana.AAC.8
MAGPDRSMGGFLSDAARTRTTALAVRAAPDRAPAAGHTQTTVVVAAPTALPQPAAERSRATAAAHVRAVSGKAGDRSPTTAEAGAALAAAPGH